MDENDAKIRERVAALEEGLRSEIQQRQNLDRIVEDMRNIVSEIRFMREELHKIDEKVNELENKPSKRWESVVAAVIGAAAGGIGTALVSVLTGG